MNATLEHRPSAFIESDLSIEELNRIALREGNSKRPIYQMHKWWARRLGSVFRMITLAALSPDTTTTAELWQHFYNSKSLDDKVVFDPFMGGGTTLVEALRLGCKVIGADLNPVAWFITKKELESVDLEALQEAFKRLETRIAADIQRYYRTTCPRGHAAEFVYGLWVKWVNCRKCGSPVHLFPNYRILRKAGVMTVVCPGCWHVFKAAQSEALVSCPNCQNVFDPSRGNSGRGRFTCTKCGYEENLLDAVRRLGGPLPLKLYAVEYYCVKCGRDHKRAEQEDIQLFEEAKQEFERRRPHLRYPRQKIPIAGRSDPRPVNHGYVHFWQMFNERQLLCLSLLLEGIDAEPDQNLRELLLLAFSDALDTNNLFCKYEEDWQKISVLFGMHAYHPIERPAENNVWGGTYGRGTFLRCFRKVLRGKEFSRNAFERILANGRSARNHVPEVLDGRLARCFDDLAAGANTLLFCADSTTHLDIPARSVDAVITDPPYLDNVMYSELADFFYVWLRLALKDDYPWFEPEYCDRAHEIVENRKDAKTSKDFRVALTKVFTQCYQVLKDDGLLIFTFHHNRLAGWAPIAQALLDAGFYVSAAPIVRSEGKSGFHSSEGNIKYDAVLVCRKRDRLIWVADWENIDESIRSSARYWIRRLIKGEMALNRVDITVITMAKCFEYALRHIPHLTYQGRQISLDEVLEKAWRGAEEIAVEMETEYQASPTLQRHLLD